MQALVWQQHDANPTRTWNIQKFEIYIFCTKIKTILQWLHRPAVLKQFAKHCLLEGPKHPHAAAGKKPLLDKKIFWQHDFHHFQVIKYSIWNLLLIDRNLLKTTGKRESENGLQYSISTTQTSPQLCGKLSGLKSLGVIIVLKKNPSYIKRFGSGPNSPNMP